MPLRLLNAFASGPEVYGIALSRDGTKLYRALSEPCVDIVELATGGVIGRIDLPGRPSRVTVSPDGRIALVAASKREPDGERGKGLRHRPEHQPPDSHPARRLYAAVT